MPSIVSSLTNAQNITQWDGLSDPDAKAGKVATKKMSVTIKGIHTLALNDNFNIKGSHAATTHITDAELEMLKQHKDFQFHLKNGSFKILNQEKVSTEKTEKVAKDMPKDNGEIKGTYGEKTAGSALLSIEGGDFKEGGRAAGPAPGEQKIV